LAFSLTLVGSISPLRGEVICNDPDILYASSAIVGIGLLVYNVVFCGTGIGLVSITRSNIEKFY
jgi:hypothetical protein